MSGCCLVIIYTESIIINFRLSREIRGEQIRLCYTHRVSGVDNSYPLLHSSKGLSRGTLKVCCILYTDVTTTYCEFYVYSLYFFIVFWCQLSCYVLVRTWSGSSIPLSPTFIHPSQSSTKSCLPHNKCSDDVSCLPVYSMYTFGTDSVQQLCSQF